MLNDKTVVFAATSLKRGGKERQLTQLFSYLNSKNKFLITERFDPNNNYLGEYKIDLNSILVIGESSLINTIRNYKKLFSDIKPDMVFTWEVKPTVVCLILLLVKKFKLINCSIRHGIRLWKRGHIFRSIIAWVSPYVIANSRAGLAVNNLKPNKHNFILYNGIDESNYKIVFRSDERVNFLKILFDHNVSEKTKIFISVANLVPYKDYFTVLSALSKIKSEYDYRYMIIGDGKMKVEINSKISGLYLRDKVKLLGSIENVNHYLALSDYFIHSSRGEGLSNAILEAMFAGLPVIASDVGGTRELVFEKSFRLFNYKDEAALSEILISVDKYFKDFDPVSPEYKNHLSIFNANSMQKNFEQIVKNISDE